VTHEHHHHHAVTPDADKRKIGVALGLILAFMAFEVVVAIIADSLALLSDAAHMLTDAGALALALVAIRLAARPAGGSMTFGFKRAEILSALLNGATLAVLGAVIVIEAVQRLIDPPEVRGALVVGVALVGMVVNIAAAWMLARAERRSLNVEGSLQHILTDLYAFIATAISGVLILTLGFDRADPIASLIVAGLMFRAAWSLTRDSGRVLLEGAPSGLDPDEIGRAMCAVPSVSEVHDLHVWEVTSGFPALSAHVLVGTDDDCHTARLAIEAVLEDRFHLHHTTLQMDHRPSTLLSITGPAGQESP
jgi:cobalt-zinc-cadmium efflux system protein